jgi:hypothetical protein
VNCEGLKDIWERGWLRAKGLWTVKFSFRVSFYNGFKCWLNQFGSVWINEFLHYKTETEPNQTEPEFLSKYSNRFNQFFFTIWFFQLFFFNFLGLSVFLLTHSRSPNFFMGSLCKKAWSCSWIWNPLGISHWNLCT